MIFITVGTHEQSFDRLLKYIDQMVEDDLIKEEIVCQKGYTDYEPKNFNADKLISYEEMQKNIENARIVITHGGPASFIAPISIGKIPIVVPRKKEFNEHVNNHQLEFAREVAKRTNSIIVVEDMDSLKDSILNYNNIIEKLSLENFSNNKLFCDNLEKVVDDFFKQD